MAIAHSAAARTALATATLNQIQTGAGANGSIRIMTAAAGTVLATLPLSATAGTVSGPTLTFAAITSATAGAAGTATYFEVMDKATTPAMVFNGSVGTSGADINFNRNTIAVGDNVAISSFTYTAPL